MAGNKIPEEVIQHVSEQVSGGAALIARNILENGNAAGFATLEDTSTGVTIGAVVVALDPEKAMELVEWIRMMPGSSEARIN